MKPKRQTISVPSMAEYFGISRTRAYRMYEEGKVEGYRIGEREGIRIYLDSVYELEKKRQGE